MQYDRDWPGGSWRSTTGLSCLTELGERLRRLGARTSSRRSPSGHSSPRCANCHWTRHLLTWRAVANAALHRALRAPERAAALGGSPATPGEADWQFAYNLALARLAEDALHELRSLRRFGRIHGAWDA